MATSIEQLKNLYPKSLALMNSTRNPEWIAIEKEKVGRQVGDAITLLDIDDSFDNLSKNSTKWVLVQAFADSVLSSFGPKITLEAKNHLRASRENSEHEINYKFTANHDTTPGLLFPINEEGERLSGTIPKNMLTLDSENGESLSLGEISPIELKEIDGSLFAVMMTPNGNEWKWEFVPKQAESYFGDPVEDSVFGNIKLHCASSDSGIIVLAPDCAEDCYFCGVLRGDGKMRDQDKTTRQKVFEKMFKNIPDKINSVFGATLSGGSSKDPDGGFAHNFKWALEELAKQLIPINKNRVNKIKMKLQLEVVLPKDKTSWQGIIDTIETYVEKGWDISLAMNQEVIQDEFESMFLQGDNKKETTTDDLVEFAKQLRKKVGNKVLVNSLILFGLKPVEMSDEEYLITQLNGIKKLCDGGIRADINPVKNNKRKNDKDPVRLEAFPAVNPALLFLQSVAVAKLNQKFDDVIEDNKVKHKLNHGCVSCSLCNPAKTVKRFVTIAENNGESIPTLLNRLLETTGRYQQQFEALFQN